MFNVVPDAGTCISSDISHRQHWRCLEPYDLSLALALLSDVILPLARQPFAIDPLNTLVLVPGGARFRMELAWTSQIELISDFSSKTSLKRDVEKMVLAIDDH